ncbi:MAG: hypothetical protein V3T31_08035 [candidate division Zixibacteria bacterium]
MIAALSRIKRVGKGKAAAVGTGDKRAARRRNLRRVRPRLLRKVRQAGYDTRIMQQRFAKEGPGWKALSPSTIKQRGSAHPILKRTGALRAAAIAAVKNTFAPDMRWANLIGRVRVRYAVNVNKTRSFMEDPDTQEKAPGIRYLRKLERRYVNTGRI